MKRVWVGSIALMTIAMMGGCEMRCQSEPKGPAEEIGEAIDKAVDDIKDVGDGDSEIKVKIKETPKP